MGFCKRYSVLSSYVGGSVQLPQYGHGTSNMWKKAYANEFSEKAKELFLDWAYKCEIEVVLKGGDDEALEKLYESLSKIEEIPCAKFNEPGMRGMCTVVTFVANERIISGVNFVRENRLNPRNVVETLTGTEVNHINKEEKDFVLSDDEIFVVSQVAFLPLAS